MHALPILMVSPPDNRTFTQGTLLKIPPELSDKTYFDALIRRMKSGWNVDQLGYWSFATRASSGLTYVVPALIIEQAPPKKRFQDYNQKFEKSQIEQYLHALILRDESYRDHAENDLNLLVHDLRQLSSAIYHQATEALDHLKSVSTRSQPHELSAAVSLVRERLNSVVASQTMLKIRTDLLDFEGAPDTAPVAERVPVYRRFDKVKKCFEPIAGSKEVSIQLTGRSLGYSRGPEVFEIIPYVLIDNAVKYSPRKSNIEIRFSESSNEIVCSVSSTGPKILDEEKGMIFTKGYRGKIALANEKNGSGLGLFLAKSLIDSFRGTISVESVHRDGDYCLNVFTVRVPKLGEMQELPRHRKVRSPKADRTSMPNPPRADGRANTASASPNINATRYKRRRQKRPKATPS
jgi:signal transduction histidine kinase